MNAILKFLLEKNRWAILLIIILLLLGGGLLKRQSNKINDLNDKYQSEVNLKKALLDTVTTYQNKEGDWVNEKRTMQADYTDLLKDKDNLTAEQKRLLRKIGEVNKEKDVIAAALYDANITIEGLTHGGIIVVDTTKKIVDFIETKNPDIRYNFRALGVLPFPTDSEPKFIINKLSLPNEVFIEFHWLNEKKEGYPMAFSVTNTNKYIETYNVNSYAIPEIKPTILDPTGWQKIGQWFEKNGKVVIYVAGGVAVGAGGTYLMMK